MENTTIILGLITAIISLVATLMPFFIKTKGGKENEININGSDNVIDQSNNVVDSYNQTHITNITATNNNSTSDDSYILFFIIAFVLILLYNYRVILLKIIWLPLIISTILSVIICSFIVRGKTITFVSKKHAIQNLFMLAPVIVSLLFVIQNIYFMRNIENIELWQKINVGTTILSNYLGTIILLVTQICTLTTHHVKHKRIQKSMLNFARLWPMAIIFPIIPLITILLQRQ